MKETDRERLIRFRQIDENGCWIWTGKTDPNGYGRINVSIGHHKIKTTKVHRYSLLLFKGIEIPDSQVVRHKCRNRKCFNPDHLELGYQSDNMEDFKKDWKNFKKENDYLFQELKKLKRKIWIEFHYFRNKIQERRTK
jgi:hypothetical protein